MLMTLLVGKLFQALSRLQLVAVLSLLPRLDIAKEVPRFSIEISVSSSFSPRLAHSWLELLTICPAQMLWKHAKSKTQTSRKRSIVQPKLCPRTLCCCSPSSQCGTNFWLSLRVANKGNAYFKWVAILEALRKTFIVGINRGKRIR